MEPYTAGLKKEEWWFLLGCNAKHEDFMTTWSTNYTNWNLGSDLSIKPNLYSNGTNRTVPLKKKFTSFV